MSCQIEIHRPPELIDGPLLHVGSCTLPVMKHFDGRDIMTLESDSLKALRQVRFFAIEEVGLVEKTDLL